MSIWIRTLKHKNQTHSLREQISQVFCFKITKFVDKDNSGNEDLSCFYSKHKEMIVPAFIVSVL